MITTETIFWTQIASVVGFVVSLFVLYRLLVDQKEATIQLQKENIAYLKDQLAQLKTQAPDVLAQSLAARVKLLEGELERLEHDKTSTQEEVRVKAAELEKARTEVEVLTQKITKARQLLSGLVTGLAGAPPAA